MHALGEKPDKRAESSASIKAFVGVISRSPLGSRALILTVAPKVTQRSTNDLPTSTISSRGRVSSERMALAAANPMP
jgi:hypothetical protein